MPASIDDTPIQTLHWVGDARTGWLRMIDQTRLPTEQIEIDCTDVNLVWEAIRSLRVRGAPAIGIAASTPPRPPPHISAPAGQRP